VAESVALRSRSNPSAVGAVVNELRSRIVDGALGEGTTLPSERVLAAQLGVSRPTLRQGLAVLSQLGLVTSVRGRNGGIRVTRPTGASVASGVTLLCRTRAITAGQLTELRRGLEVEAAQLAAVRRTPDDLRHIDEALGDYIRSAADPIASNQDGRRLHYVIARAAHNPLLVEMLASIDPALAESIDLTWPSCGGHEDIERIHRPIVAAIASGDAVAARAAMVAHFAQIERSLTELGLWNRPVGRLSEDAGRAAGVAPAQTEGR